jgi:3-deoxy-7-phosphoheptulonate synthase
VVPQHIADLICWAAIGARTTESQTHREMASGLSMPVGFKNGTDGNVQTAIDAMKSSQSPHSFVGIDQDGMTSVIKTAGNPDCHVVLRGGRLEPNYSAEQTAEGAAKIEAAGVRPALMVDCSHANSGKKPERQPEVFREILRQREEGNSPVVGAMLESFIHEGNQSLPGELNQLKYGISVTDGCMSWEMTEQLLLESLQVPAGA